MRLFTHSISCWCSNYIHITARKLYQFKLPIFQTSEWVIFLSPIYGVLGMVSAVPARVAWACRWHLQKKCITPNFKLVHSWMFSIVIVNEYSIIFDGQIIVKALVQSDMRGYEETEINYILNICLLMNVAMMTWLNCIQHSRVAEKLNPHEQTKW